MCVCECRMCRPAKSDKIKCREIKFRAPTKAKRDKSKVFAQLRPLCISGHHGEFLSLPLSCEQDMQGEVSCALCLGHRKSLFQKIENAKFHLCNVRHSFLPWNRPWPNALVLDHPLPAPAPASATPAAPPFAPAPVHPASGVAVVLDETDRRRRWRPRRRCLADKAILQKWNVLALAAHCHSPLWIAHPRLHCISKWQRGCRRTGQDPADQQQWRQLSAS